jgi:hypothetical protein
VAYDDKTVLPPEDGLPKAIKAVGWCLLEKRREGVVVSTTGAYRQVEFVVSRWAMSSVHR